MNVYANLALPNHLDLTWSTLFAQEPDQDLEFDEGLEEDDLQQHKPPTRRPLLWILLLLIAVGVIYWMMKPDLAKLPELPASDVADTVVTTPPQSQKGDRNSKPSVPPPLFGEGHTVTVALTN